MTGIELVANLRRMADDLEKLLGSASAPAPRPTEVSTAKDEAPRGGVRKRVHWSQTPEGKARIRKNMKKVWRKKRAEEK